MKKLRADQEDKDCWFCLDNPGIEKNLIVNEGGSSDFYLAVPKGPVIDEHFLIVPKKHIAHSLELSDTQEEDIAKMKQRVLNYLSNDKRMDYIVFERNMPFNF
jgi:galactose-1-phosphate uridylyltransferase